MIMNVADDDVRYPFLHVLASVLAWASAVLNPFIYAFKNRQYQQAFAKVRKDQYNTTRVPINITNDPHVWHSFDAYASEPQTSPKHL